MPSFDIVSKLELSEVDNALAGMSREIATRFDFKGSKCSISREEEVLTILADDDMKLKQMHELLRTYLTRRKIDVGALEFKPQEKAAGDTVRQIVQIKQGIDRDLGKRLMRDLKDSKLKLQVSVQGDELRVTGKQRDDLQAAIAFLRTLKIEQPIQYVNFRD